MTSDYVKFVEFLNKNSGIVEKNSIKTRDGMSVPCECV